MPHLWFFVADAVSAADARKLGFILLTRTMATGAALSVASCDRLFPSQDVLPNGGFGNLIALPLQLEARKAGNTEFVDDDFAAHKDQWSYLASVPRIAPDHLGELIALSKEEGELAIRSVNEDPRAPWRSPRPLRECLRDESMPGFGARGLSDRLYVDRSGLPAALAHAVRRLATFSNPLFLELQRMRMSVARTPRVIGCFEDLAMHTALPRGCLGMS